MSFGFFKHLHLNLKIKLTLIHRLNKLATAPEELKDAVLLFVRLVTDFFVSLIKAFTDCLVDKLSEDFDLDGLAFKTLQYLHNKLF